MPKCEFNKVAKQLYWNHTSAWVFSSKFAAYFQNTFPEKHLWMASSEYKISGIIKVEWIIDPWTEGCLERFLWTKWRSSHLGCSIKKMFLKILKHLQENTCVRIRVSFLIKLRATWLQLYEKRDPGTSVFLRILRNF